MQTNMTTKKNLTNVRLINWHYFTDCTIPIHGSTLFTGENGTGKSVILDAIQMVLTTNTTKFNQASQKNEDKRNLLGYVRCKTGREDQPYLRGEGTVISYVALEFYEERKEKFFVIGARLEASNMDTPDKKWFIVEGSLDSITFMDDKNRPVIEKNFTQNGTKIHLETSVQAFRQNMFRRLGGLSENFKEMLMNSMSFVAISDVKGFINKFILPEKKVDIDNLRENITSYREMGKILEVVKAQILQLQEIINTGDEISENERKLKVNEIMFKIADITNFELKIGAVLKEEQERNTKLELANAKIPAVETRKDNAGKELLEIQVSCNENECHTLIKQLENSLGILKERALSLESDNKKFEQELKAIASLSKYVNTVDKLIYVLKDPNASLDEKTKKVTDFRLEFDGLRKTKLREQVEKENSIEKFNNKRVELDFEIQELKKNNISYPTNSVILRDTINAELKKINAPVEARIMADFLDITDLKWQNAVEGYLNTQRFYIIVDEKYYDAASAIYDGLKSRLSGVGLVNFAKLPDVVPEEHSLANVLTSTSALATKYINYLLGNVICCDSVAELKKYDKSITSGCMMYQNHVLRKIDPKVYEKPYIGKNAIKIQLEKATKEMDELSTKIKALNDEVSSIIHVVNVLNSCQPARLSELLGAPAALNENKKEIQSKNAELTAAKNNPNYIELNLKLEEKRRALKEIEYELDGLKKARNDEEVELRQCRNYLLSLEEQMKVLKAEIEQEAKEKPLNVKEAQSLFDDNYKTKSPDTIVANYKPRSATFVNNIDRLNRTLASLQTKYKEQELGVGPEYLPAYRKEYERLSKSELVSYEEQFAEAKELCEIEFRQSFLSKMREHIVNAENKFSELNKSLKDVYYGNDSYHFLLTGSAEKISLYNMIKSELNLEGDTLFTDSFEEKYKAEQDELFDKLTNQSLDEEKILKEYTDYRSYLDYDIEVIDRLGRKMKLSKTGGEKSGGEKQTPFYVACAASFRQIYSVMDESIRLVLLDEPFNNMDDSRIRTMMKFLRDEMGFQLIMAAPDGKLQVLHEYVDGVRTTVQVGDARAVREFDFNGRL